MKVTVFSMMAAAFQDDESPFDSPVWQGELDAMDPEEAIRFFNRVDDSDGHRLEDIGYRLPSLSVGDIIVLGRDTYRVMSAGFTAITSPRDYVVPLS